MARPASDPSPIGVWLMAARPKTLTAAIVPVVVGTALAAADGAFRAGAALAALVAAVAIQVGTNFSNDYFDAKKGIDRDRRGPTRVTQAGLVSFAQIRTATTIAFGCAVLCGIYLVAAAGWPVLIIGLFSILAGLAYTGGPYPLGYHGLGDLFVFLFFGIVAVAGTYYVQAHRMTGPVLLLAVPIGLLSTAILVANNLRDAESDRHAGKLTLVARFGRRFGGIEYTVLLAGAYAVPAILVGLGEMRPWGLLPILSLPLCAPLLRAAFRATELEEQVRMLGGTSRLLLVYGLLLSVGVMR